MKTDAPAISPLMLELASGRCPDCGAPVDFGPGKVDTSEPGERWIILQGRCVRCEERWRVEIPDQLRGHCACGKAATLAGKTLCVACYAARRRAAAAEARPRAVS